MNKFSFILCVLTLSCGMHNTGNIYKPGREWEFDLKNSRSLRVDKVKLTVLNETWVHTQTKIEWLTLVKREDGSYVGVTEQTGVIDETDAGMESGKIWIHPPRSGDLRLAELVPFPEIRLPMKIGDTYPSSLTPDEGWGDLKGVSVEGRLSVTGKVQYKPELIDDSCWVIDAKGKSSKGEFSARYYFHSLYGFVYMKYDLGRDTSELTLRRTNFPR